jgi:Dyp-type peroxidase family
MNARTSTPTAPTEPVLELDDIQGAAVPGFLKPYQTLLGINCRNSVEDINRFKLFLRDLSERITPGRKALDDRRDYRRMKSLKQAGQKKPEAFVAVAFTSQSLLKLTPGAAAIPSVAFQLGLTQRSQLLGDPPDPLAEGNPANWIVGGAKGELDALIIIAGDHPDLVDNTSRTIRTELDRAQLLVPYEEHGAVRHDKKGHEHFGFDDGVSQPGIRGRASKDPADFITPRYIAQSEVPSSWLFGYPGQDLVWPGEFLLGAPATGADPLLAGPAVQPIPEWTRNGSFLVFRRLRQDVGLFWRTMKQEADRLSKDKGFVGLTDEALAAKLVGRWLSGAPVNRTPDKDLPDLGKCLVANNHFGFDSETLPVAFANPHDHDNFPPAKADPAGTTCPWAAHIRKVNTRDSGSDMGARDTTYNRRLLRVGVPFGKPLQDRYAELKNDPEHGNRGLLFLSVQASIENQFEFLCSRWANDPARPKMPGGHDFIIGQNSALGEARTRQCVLFGSDTKPASVATNQEWVIPTGGGYFFLPSIRALKDVLCV